MTYIQIQKRHFFFLGLGFSYVGFFLLLHHKLIGGVWYSLDQAIWRCHGSMGALLFISGWVWCYFELINLELV